MDEKLVQMFFEAHAELHSARWGGTLEEVRELENKMSDLRANFPEATAEEQEALNRYNDLLRKL